MSDNVIIKEITELTMRLKNSHPEVYARLDENPITLKIARGHEASHEELEEYLRTLESLLNEYHS